MKHVWGITILLLFVSCTPVTKSITKSTGVNNWSKFLVVQLLSEPSFYDSESVKMLDSNLKYVIRNKSVIIFEYQTLSVYRNGSIDNVGLNLTQWYKNANKGLIIYDKKKLKYLKKKFSNNSPVLLMASFVFNDSKQRVNFFDEIYNVNDTNSTYLIRVE